MHISQIFGPYAQFITGAMIGSFLNVCIYRLPLSLSIISPRSHCGKCKSMIAWYDNIPILSFLVLRGRCRKCGIGIGLVHPFVELFVGLTMLGSFHFFGFSFLAIYFFVLSSAIVTLSAIDIRHRIIPDSISIGGMVMGMFLATLFQAMGKSWHVSIIDSMLGVVLGAGFLWFIAWAYEKLTGKEGMGFGDVKLLGFFGANMGAEGAFVSIFVGSLVGTLFGFFLIVLKKGDRKTVIPFGPFLALGFLVYMFDMFNIMNFPLEWIVGYVPKF